MGGYIKGHLRKYISRLRFGEGGGGISAAVAGGIEFPQCRSQCGLLK